jgi:hypothetical protein
MNNADNVSDTFSMRKSQMGQSRYGEITSKLSPVKPKAEDEVSNMLMRSMFAN